MSSTIVCAPASISARRFTSLSNVLGRVAAFCVSGLWFAGPAAAEAPEEEVEVSPTIIATATASVSSLVPSTYARSSSREEDAEREGTRSGGLRTNSGASHRFFSVGGSKRNTRSSKMAFEKASAAAAGESSPRDLRLASFRSRASSGGVSQCTTQKRVWACLARHQSS